MMQSIEPKNGIVVTWGLNLLEGNHKIRDTEGKKKGEQWAAHGKHNGLLCLNIVNPLHKTRDFFV